MKNITKEVEWFLVVLQKEFNVIVKAEDVAVEATELGIEEVEDFFVPREIMDPLPETLLYEIMVVDDEKENQWVGAIAFQPNSAKWCLQVITKNDELVYRNLLKESKSVDFHLDYDVGRASITSFEIYQAFFKAGVQRVFPDEYDLGLIGHHLFEREYINIHHWYLEDEERNLLIEWFVADEYPKGSIYEGKWFKNGEPLACPFDD